MTLSIDIPNGEMIINVDQFLPEAKIGQIRKAAKLMEPKQAEEVVLWLKSQIPVIHKQALDIFDKHLAEKEQIAKLESQILAPAVYCITAEKVPEFKKQLKTCRRLSSKYLNDAEKRVRLKTRYVKLVREFGFEKPKCYTPNDDPYPLCKGADTPQGIAENDCCTCCLYEDFENKGQRV